MSRVSPHSPYSSRYPGYSWQPKSGGRKSPSVFSTYSDSDVKEVRKTVPKKRSKSCPDYLDRSPRYRPKAKCFIYSPVPSDFTLLLKNETQIRKETPLFVDGFLSFTDYSQSKVPYTNLLAGVSNPHPILLNVQERINYHWNNIHSNYWKEVTEFYKEDIGTGFIEKYVLAPCDEKNASAYLVKHSSFLSSVPSYKIHFLSVFANVCGMYTSLAFPVGNVKGCEKLNKSILIEWFYGMTTPFALSQTKTPYDFSRLNVQTMTYLFIARWFNELIGNLENWSGQYLVPKDEKTRYQWIFEIDLDEALNYQDAKKFCTQLTERGYKVRRGEKGEKQDITEEDCSYVSQPFDFERSVGWDTKTFDGEFSFFGWFLQACVLDKSKTFDSCKRKLEQHFKYLSSLSDTVLNNIMNPYVEMSANHRQSSGRVLAGDALISEQEFKTKMMKRFRTSLTQFRAFLDKVEGARKNNKSKMYRFYKEMKPAIFC